MWLVRIGSALSTNPDSLAAVEDALGRALASLDGEAPQLTICSDTCRLFRHEFLPKEPRLL